MSRDLEHTGVKGVAIPPGGRSRRVGGLPEVREAVDRNYGQLSPGQRRVIDAMLANPRLGAVVSAFELGQSLGLSESTVTRAAQALGFAGFPDLQSRLREQFVGGVPERVEASTTTSGVITLADELRHIMLEDIESLKATLETLDDSLLTEAVRILIQADTVYIFGARGSFGLAVMLNMGLQLLLPSTRLVTAAIGDVPDQMATISESDALVAISFPRVDATTLHVMRHASSVNAPVIGLAASLVSPVARLASVPIIAQLGRLRLMPSFVSGASLVNALIAGVSLERRSAVSGHLHLAEQLWESFGTYDES